MGKRRCTLARDTKAALVNDARLGEFPATHLAPYSQAADVVRLPEQKKCGDGAYVGENTGGEPLPSKTLFAEKGKERFAWRSRWDSNPRASKG